MVVFILVVIAYLAAPEDSEKVTQRLPQRPRTRRTVDADIDRYFGDRDATEPALLHGGLTAWRLLCPSGDGRGEVLTALNAVWYAELGSGETTDDIVLDREQYILYVISGEGTIRAGGKEFPLVEGTGALAPPGVGFILEADKNASLALYIMAENVPGGAKTAKGIVVKSDYDAPISSNVSRVGTEDALFSRQDGLVAVAVVDVVMHEPRAAIQPHVHPPEVEEIWAAVDDIVVQIGLRRRMLRPGSVYRAPSDGRTPHTNINPSTESKKTLWLMAYPEEEDGTRSASKLDTI